MADSNILLAVSAFSGLTGAIFTQSIAALNTYFTDKRKLTNEVKATYRSKKMEVGENFYQVTGEKLALIRTHIEYWKRRDFAKSEASLNFLNREMKRLKADMERVNPDSLKFNLVHLYYYVKLCAKTINELNAVSQNHYLKFLDTIDAFKNASDEANKEELLQQYAIILFDMCGHYQKLYDQMEQDMNLVKDELLREFEFTHQLVK